MGFDDPSPRDQEGPDDAEVFMKSLDFDKEEGEAVDTDDEIIECMTKEFEEDDETGPGIGDKLAGTSSSMMKNKLMSICLPRTASSCTRPRSTGSSGYS